MTKYYVDPISRIEGHLGVDLERNTGTGLVEEADCHGNLWRGFENFLIGRVPNDAITFTQRICGVCPVPHGMTSTFAVEAALNYNANFQTFSTSSAGGTITPKALHIRNLILGSEFLMSSLTHFYHLAAPSYVQGPAIPPWTPYFAEAYYNPLLLSKGHGINVSGTAAVSPVQGALPALGTVAGTGSPVAFPKDLWSAVITQYVKALRIRRLTFEAGAMFSGRMPMTSALIAGGVGFNKNTDILTRINKFQELTAEVGTFVVQEYVPLVLALGALYGDYDNANNSGLNPDDLVTPRVGKGYGAGVGNFLAWGGFPQDNGSLALSNGYMRLGVSGNMFGAPLAATTINSASVLANLKEDITHSRYAQGTAAQGYNGTNVAYPGTVSRTIPKRDDPTNKYSWLKAPRFGGNPMEVGPMARMFVMGIFVSGSLLAVTANLTPLGLVGYQQYAIGHTGTGTVPLLGGIALNPAMIEPGLAVSLVRSGLAALYLQNTATLVADSTNIDTLTAQQIVDAYTNTGAGAAGQLVITGIVTNFILNLTAGLSTMDRLRARAIESLYLVQKMIGAPTLNQAAATLTWPTSGANYTASWLGKLDAAKTQGTYVATATPTTPVGPVFGATEAPRGALMHFISINNGKIVQYQCVVPTTWNGSPKDAAGLRGPIEQAMIGVPYATATQSITSGGTGTVISGIQGGVEALRVAQSFDPCIACAVH